jgi:subtilisin family serine protease
MGHRVRTTQIVLLLVVILASQPWAGVPEDVSPTCAEQVTAVVAGRQGTILDADTAMAIAATNLRAIGAKEVAAALGVSGSGQTIAVIDTGIDVMAPAFRQANGVLRIVGWRDLTGEGASTALSRCTPDRGFIEVSGQRLDVSKLESLSGSFYVGVLPESIGSKVGRDLFFVVFDPAIQGRFEAVAIDSNGDMSFEGEAVLYQFDESRTAATVLPYRDLGFSVIVADILDNGKTIVFGADLNGHGTGLASLAAASGPGSYSGVAPAASLLAVKVLDSSGKGSWSSILRGVKYALAKGADIVLLGAVPDSATVDPEWNTVQKLAESKRASIVVPAGNRGPGAGSLTVSKGAASTLVVGGYLAEGCRVPGFTVSRDVWYPWSAAGPLPDGSKGVDLVAPALAAVPAVGYSVSPGFLLLEGTSASSAYVAGGLALLREAAGTSTNVHEEARLLLALLEGCAPMPNTLPLEAGRGKINIAAAWDAFKSGIAETGLKIARKWDGIVSRGGVFLRGGAIGAFPMWVDNLAPYSRIVDVRTTADWLRVQADYLGVPAVSQRNTWVLGNDVPSPGLYCSEVIVDDPSTPGRDDSILVSEAVPQRATEDAAGCPRVFRFYMPSGPEVPVSRQFLEVPHSVESMEVRIAPALPGAILSVYNPVGQLVYQEAAGDTSVTIGLPMTGLWQMCIHQDPSLSIPRSLLHEVTITLSGVVVADKATDPDSQVFLVSIPTKGAAASDFSILPLLARFRVRRSTSMSTSSSTTVVFPEITEEAVGLSIRIGSVSGSVLQAHLYRFSDTEGRWVEIASCSTDSSGLGQIHYPSPTVGKYVAYIEAYGKDPQVYGEMDVLVLDSGAAVSANVRISTTVQDIASQHVSGEVAIDARGQPQCVVLKNATGSAVLGVVESTPVEQAAIPLVQLMGVMDAGQGRGIRTIRAWTPDGRYAVDIVVSVGQVYYQLDTGKLTARVSREGPVVWTLPGTARRVVLLP